MGLDKAMKAILDFLKQPLKYSIGLGAAAAIALFFPNSVVTQMGLLKYRDEAKPYLGGILLLCMAVAIAAAIGAGVRKWDHHSFLRSGKKRLHRLTVEEKQILRQYVNGQTRSVHLSINSGVVSGLVSEGIIYRSSDLSNPHYGRTAFAYNIQPWAWDYLNKHGDLLNP